MMPIIVATCHVITYRVLSKGSTDDATVGSCKVTWGESECEVHGGCLARSCKIRGGSDVYILRRIRDPKGDADWIHFYPTTFVLDPLGKQQSEISQEGMDAIRNLSDDLMRILHETGWLVKPEFWGPIDFLKLMFSEDGVEVTE